MEVSRQGTCTVSWGPYLGQALPPLPTQHGRAQGTLTDLPCTPGLHTVTRRGTTGTESRQHYLKRPGNHKRKPLFGRPALTRSCSTLVLTSLAERLYHLDNICTWPVVVLAGYAWKSLKARQGAALPGCIQIVDVAEKWAPICSLVI